MPKKRRRTPEAVSDLKSLKQDLKRGGANGDIRRPPKEGITVRFPYEPDDADHPWVKCYEHFDQENGYSFCVGEENDCEGCETADRAPSQRYLANAIDTTENKMIAFLMPKTLAKKLITKYDRYHTLTDRNYDILVEGQGLDTEYDVDSESPSKMNTSRYKPFDLEALIEGAANDDGDDDDDDDRSRRPVPRKAVKKAAKKAKRSTIADDDEDDLPRRPSVKRSVSAPSKKAVKKPVKKIKRR